MRTSKDYKQVALDTLRGSWKIAVLVTLVAILLGGTVISGPEIQLEIEDSWAKAVISFLGITVASLGGSPDSSIGIFLNEYITILLIGSIIIQIMFLLLGSIIEIGYNRFHLNLLDRAEAKMNDLFQYFRIWKTAFASLILQAIYTLLWTCLFIIPGILAALNYSMTGYILAEHPELTASEAIRKSKEMMKGNRWRLFCLELSFIGWGILCIFTLEIGQLWLVPYKKSAMTAFYKDISKSEETVEVMG